MRTIIRDNYTPEPGDYHDMYVFDEAQGKSWRFDCDGVFYETTIENELGDSTTTAASQALVSSISDGIDEKIAEAVEAEADIREAADDVLQEEIDAIKNSPDVVDIVATYADLQAYDTSSLGTDDIVRVLRDETHDGASTYYRWNDPNAGWNFIGTVGDYYTTAQVDTLLAGKQDTLTAGANISIDSNNVISATDTTYTAGTNVSISSDNVISATDTTYSDFVGTDGTVAGSAGLVPAPATTDAGKFLKADGTWDTAGGGSSTLYDTIYGSNTDGAPTQNAVSAALFDDPTTGKNIHIGAGAGDRINIGGINSTPLVGSIALLGTASNARNGISIGKNSYTRGHSVAIGSGNSGADAARCDSFDSVAIGTAYTSGNSAVAIGDSAYATGNYGISIGSISSSNGGNYNVAIGYNSQVFNNTYHSVVCLGAGARPSASGEVAIGCSALGNIGYNNTPYRLISGVYDGQSAHDAATVAQGNTLSSTAPTSSTEGVLGQLFTDTTNGVLYHCTAIDTTDPNNPVYTWDTVGGGSGPTVVQTTGTSTTDVMSQNAVTSMVFADPAVGKRVRIGTTQSVGDTSVSIGYTAQAYGMYSVAISGARGYSTADLIIGYNADHAYMNKPGCVVLGGNATIGNYQYSVALGYDSGRNINANGMVDIGLRSTSTLGYNSGPYRLLTGLYDPQGDHDAATKGYVDGMITMTDTDPGEGVALAAGKFIAVYDSNS